jgi:hypothetical protein
VSARCPVCRKQIRRPSYVSLKDRRSRREIRYHGAPHLAACLEAPAAEAERRGPAEIIFLSFYHSCACGDPAGKLSCRVGSFAVSDAQLEEGRSAESVHSL